MTPRLSVIFFGKPTCINNKKQVRLLEGLEVNVVKHDLLTTHWTPNLLREFFSGSNPENWINKAAPRIKSGELDPTLLSEEDLLKQMCIDPVLIRRPLIVVGDHRLCGFHWPLLGEILGIQDIEVSQDMETCMRNKTQEAL